MTSKPDITDEIIAKWQKITDLIATLMQVPAALIMRVYPTEIEVFISSDSDGNPYQRGSREHLNSGLYCETVMAQRDQLLVPNALEDPEWDKNPDIKLNMISYLGFPLVWPDGEVFGTLCVLDNKTNHYSDAHKKLLEHFREVIEGDLRLLVELQQHRYADDGLRKLSQAVEQSPTSIVITDLKGNIEYVNPKFTQVTGYTAEEAYGQNPRILKSGHTSGEEYKNMWETVSHGGIWTGEFHNKKKNGDLYWELASISPIRDSDGVITHYIAIKEDITERKRIEDALKKSEHVLKRAQHVAHVGSWELDVVTNRLTWSDEVFAIFGMDPDESVATYEAFLDRVYSDDRAEVDAAYANSLREGKDGYEIEHRIIRLDNGEIRYVYEKCEHVKDESRNIIGSIGIVHDITDRKQTELALRESEELYRQMFVKNNAIKLLIDPQTGQIVEANPAAAQFYGYPVDVLTTMRIFDVNTLSEAEIAEEMTKAKNQTKDFFQFKHRLASGEVRDVEVHSGPIAIHGKILLYSIIIDVTRQKVAEKALVDMNERFRLAFQTSPDAININRMEDGVYIDSNDGFRSIMGYTRDEVIGKTSLDLNVWKNPEDRVRLVKVLKKDGYCENIEAEFVTKEGEVRVGLMSARITSIDNTPCIISITRDITDRRKLELEAQKAEALRIELEKEKELVNLKDRVLSIISHEFRTPLAVIQTSSDLVTNYKDKMSPEREQELLDQIIQQVGTLNNMIDDILLIGRGRAGKTKFNASEFDLVAFCKTVFDQVSFTDKSAHQFEFVSQVDSLTIQADKQLLHHVLMNLLSNAIKYSPVNCRISLEIRNHDNHATVMVLDEGLGIPEEDKKYLFDPFHRAKNVENIQGTGLGLSIAKHYIELHRGTIDMESQLGKGSTFKVRLPLTR